jgi:hypothetical protein
MPQSKVSVQTFQRKVSVRIWFQSQHAILKLPGLAPLSRPGAHLPCCPPPQSCPLDPHFDFWRCSCLPRCWLILHSYSRLRFPHPDYFHILRLPLVLLPHVLPPRLGSRLSVSACFLPKETSTLISFWKDPSSAKANRTLSKSINVE